MGGRIFAGEPGAVMMTDIRGASNAKASASSDGSRAIRAGVGVRDVSWPQRGWKLD